MCTYRVVAATVGHGVEAGAVVVVGRQARAVLYAHADALVVRVDLALVQLVRLAALLRAQPLLRCDTVTSLGERTYTRRRKHAVTSSVIYKYIPSQPSSDVISHTHTYTQHSHAVTSSLALRHRHKLSDVCVRTMLRQTPTTRN